MFVVNRPYHCCMVTAADSCRQGVNLSAAHPRVHCKISLPGHSLCMFCTCRMGQFMAWLGTWADLLRTLSALYQYSLDSELSVTPAAPAVLCADYQRVSLYSMPLEPVEPCVVVCLYVCACLPQHTPLVGVSATAMACIDTFLTHACCGTSQCARLGSLGHSATSGWAITGVLEDMSLMGSFAMTCQFCSTAGCMQPPAVSCMCWSTHDQLCDYSQDGIICALGLC